MRRMISASPTASAGPLPDGLAVPEDREIVGEGADLLEAVRHEHHRGPGIPQGAHLREQMADLGGGERRRGLVERDHARPAGQGAAQLDELLLGDRQQPHRDRGIRQHEPEPPEDVPRAGAHRAPVEKPVPAVLHPEEQVRVGAELRDERQLLVDDRDARFAAPGVACGTARACRRARAGRRPAAPPRRGSAAAWTCRRRSRR